MRLGLRALRAILPRLVTGEAGAAIDNEIAAAMGWAETKPVTTDLQAALALLPERAEWSVVWWTDSPPPIRHQVFSLDAGGPYNGEGETHAAALCVAAIRAQIATEEYHRERMVTLLRED